MHSIPPSPNPVNRPFGIDFALVLLRFYNDALKLALRKIRPRLFHLCIEIARIWHENDPQMVELLSLQEWCVMLHTTPRKLTADMEYLRAHMHLEEDSMRLRWFRLEETPPVPAAVPETNGAANGHRRRRESDDAYNARRRAEKAGGVNGGADSSPPEADGGAAGVRPSLTPEITPEITPHTGADKAKSPVTGPDSGGEDISSQTDTGPVPDRIPGLAGMVVAALVAEDMEPDRAKQRVDDEGAERWQEALEALRYRRRQKNPPPPGKGSGWMVDLVFNKRSLPKAMIDARERDAHQAKRDDAQIAAVMLEAQAGGEQPSHEPQQEARSGEPNQYRSVTDRLAQKTRNERTG